MSEQAQESAQEQVSQELPTPKFTETSAGQPSSVIDMDLIAQKVAEKLQPTISQTVQSVKDKRFAKYDEALGRLGILDDLRAQGVTIPENVELKMRLAELEGKTAQPISGKVETAVAETVSQTVSEIVKEAELDASDPRVVEWMRGTYRNPDHMRAEGLALKRKLASPPPNPSAVSPQAAPIQPVNEAGMKAAYIKEVAAARGNKSLGRAIQEKYRASGLDIDHIDLTKELKI